MANNIGFVGTGMMASSLIDGIVAKGIRTANQIHCSDIYPPAREAASKKGIQRYRIQRPRDAVRLDG